MKRFAMVLGCMLMTSMAYSAAVEIANVKYSTSTTIVVSSSAYTVESGTHNVKNLEIQNFKSNTGYVTYASEDGGAGPRLEAGESRIFEDFNGSIYLKAESKGGAQEAPINMTIGIFKKLKQKQGTNYGY